MMTDPYAPCGPDCRALRPITDDVGGDEHQDCPTRIIGVPILFVGRTETDEYYVVDTSRLDDLGFAGEFEGTRYAVVGHTFLLTHARTAQLAADYVGRWEVVSICGGIANCEWRGRL